MGRRFAILACLSLVFSACSPAGSTVSVQLKEFQITPASSTAMAPKVTFRATNGGTTAHELVVFKTDLAPDKLPVEGDSVNEEGPGLSAIGEIAEFAPGKTQSKKMDLAPGNYVLICNVPTHYAQGMHAALKVT